MLSLKKVVKWPYLYWKEAENIYSYYPFSKVIWRMVFIVITDSYRNIENQDKFCDYKSVQNQALFFLMLMQCSSMKI